MTDQLPRAPKLDEGTCIATAALFESAQRVFLHQTTSPIHWIDLCTLIEAIFLHEKIAFPMLHRDYADPLLAPLTEAGLADPWWPETNILPSFSTKEESWRSAIGGDQGVQLLKEWPDKRYESLSQVRQKAVDGIAHGFAEPVLLKDRDEMSVLLWGRKARGSSQYNFEAAAVSWLRQGLDDMTNLSPSERAAFSIPHVTFRDTYNHYASNMRALANDAQATIVKSVIEEPFFDPVSVETAARDTLHMILKKNYESKVVGTVARYTKFVPASPFGGMAISRAKSLEEVLKIAIDLRDLFKSYRDLLRTHREIHKELVKSQKFSLAKELEQIESTFTQALEYCMRGLDPKYDQRPNIVFAGLQGIRKVFIGAVTGDFKPTIDKFAEEIIELIGGWYYMNYGGVYEIVSQLSKIEQLNAASRRLTGRELDGSVAEVLKKASATLKNNYGLMKLES